MIRTLKKNLKGRRKLWIEFNRLYWGYYQNRNGQPSYQSRRNYKEERRKWNEIHQSLSETFSNVIYSSETYFYIHFLFDTSKFEIRPI